MRWAAWLAVVALAGCLGGQPDEPATPEPTRSPDPTPPPTPPAPPPRVPMLLDFGYAQCDGQRSHFQLPPETIAERLPPGYVSAGEGRVEYLWMGCASFATARAEVNDTVYGHVAIRIEPPADALDAAEHWYRLRMLTGPDVLADVWRAAAYDVYAARFAAAGGPGPRTVRLGDYTVTGVELVGDESMEASVAYYTEVPAGRLEWSGAMGLAATMAVLQLDVPADDPFVQAHSGVPDTAWSVRGDVPANDLWLRPTPPE